MLKNKLEKELAGYFGIKVALQDAGSFADFAIVPEVTKKLGEDIEEVAGKIKDLLGKSVKDVQVVNGFINIVIKDEIAISEMEELSQDIEGYLSLPAEKTVVIDYSGPNIAKPFSVGHLRSTVIGQANLNIHKALGYKTVGINHIGDWGTQFGKLIYAIINWSDEKQIESDPINELNKLYVKFHEEAEKNPNLEDEARGWSKKLEDGDEEARRIWKKCVDWSFKEFERIYEILDIKIDRVIGESFFEDKLDEVIKELEQKQLLKESDGALIVELTDLPPALIKRKDGATLYLTRDLAALKYRISEFTPSKIIYHVGQDQQLHFKQLVAVAEKLGWLEETEVIFAGHGLMRLPEGKMSTRKGRVVLLSDLIDQAKEKVLSVSPDRNVDEKKVQQIAVSAIKYADLSVNRKSDIVFSLEKMTDLKGNSSVYLEYSYARLKSLTREFEAKHKTEIIPDLQNFSSDQIEIIKECLKIKEVLIRSAETSQPNLLSDYTYSLSNKFNSFYEKNRVITESAEESTLNILVIELLLKVIGKSLDLLGISKFDRF